MTELDHRNVKLDFNKCTGVALNSNVTEYNYNKEKLEKLQDQFFIVYVDFISPINLIA